MTDRELMQQALDAMLNFPNDISDEMFEAMKVLKARLAQPEPAAYHNDYLEQVARTAVRAFHRLDESPFGAGRVLRDIALDMIEYAKKQTTPPRKEWQGLTEVERLDILDAELTTQSTEHFALAQAIEAKLKEKNSG